MKILYIAIFELKMLICCNFGRKLCCGWKEMSLPDLSRASINKTQASHHSKWCHLFSSAQKWCQSCQSYVHANTCKHTCKHKATTPNDAICFLRPKNGYGASHRFKYWHKKCQYMIFSYASSSTPHTCQRVSEWVGNSFGLA